LHITDKQIFIVKNVSNLKGIEPGSEILSVNGVPAADIISKLLTLVKADGDNNGKRLSDLQVSGLGKYEAFDIYFPLLFPAKKGTTYTVQILPFKSSNYIEIDVPTISRELRKELLLKKFNVRDLPADSLLEFKLLDNGNTAYLKLGTFDEFQLKMDWRKFLANAFKVIEKKKITNLIIDIRNNEGGTDNIPAELLTYILSKPLVLEKAVDLVRYQKMKPSYKIYIDTWDKSVFDFTGKVEQYNEGYFRLLNSNSNIESLKPKKKIYKGKIVLLVNEANSSGTFLMAKIAKYNKFATLVGTETGGDNRGINAGVIGFMRLPSTKIEVDIPLIGTYYAEGTPGGVQPDIKVHVPAMPFLNEKDFYLNAALEYINKK
jgi:C-terminal processing protease CtpA/Prc